jgi:hypothetical protein
MGNTPRAITWKSAWELIVPAMCVYAWFWCLYEVSPKDPLWADELLTRYLVMDKSPLNMLDAVADGVDGSPPAFWLTTWAWEKFAGATPLALRFATTFWVTVGFVVSWFTFRRRYGFHAASIATATAYFLAPVLWKHAFEARHYGLLVAGVASVNLTTEILFDTEGGKVRRGPWIANALANALVVNTHLFGFFYAGSTALAFALADLRLGRIRWRLWGSYVAGWLTFLPWLPSLKRQQQSTEWGFWAPVPKPDAITGYGAYIQDFPLAKLALVLLAFGTLALLLRGGVEKKPRPDVTSPAPIAGFLYVILVPSVAYWLSVHRTTSVWVDRYMTPQFLGWAALMAVALDRLGVDRPLRGTPLPRLLRGAAMLAATLYFVRFLTGEAREAAHAKSASSVGPIDTSGLPIAAEMSHRVLEQWYYQPQVDISYLLDPGTVERIRNGPAIDYKIMAALGRHYPVKTVPIEDFLAQHPKFLHLETFGFLGGVLGTSRGTAYQWKTTPRGQFILVTRVDR